MKRSYIQPFALVILSALVLLLVGTPAAIAANYGGRAFGDQLRLVTPQPNVLTFSDTGELPAQGGNLSVTLVTLTVGVGTLSSKTITASTDGANNVTTSIASQEELVAFAGQPAQLTASVVRAESQASCAGTQGASVVTNLTFGGQSVSVSGAPNQTVTIANVATLVINEQFGDTTTLTVNALHLYLGTGDELIVSSARAHMSCPLAAQPAAWSTVKTLYRGPTR